MSGVLLPERRWLEDDDGVVVGGGDLAAVDGGRHAAHVNVAVAHAGHDLHALERRRQDDQVAPGSVRLESQSQEKVKE